MDMETMLTVLLWMAGIIGTLGLAMLSWLKIDMTSLKNDLKNHERNCEVNRRVVDARDRDLVGKVNWVMGKLGAQVPETSKPEAPATATE